tara:strand:- start:913 stop:1359 length:447 start_codon:yes stop_codon:yes gene_type:complete
MEFYIKIDVKYKNNEYSMLHEEWIKLDTSQEKIQSLTNNHKIFSKDNNILQTFSVKNIEDFNKLLKWSQEDEQKEFLIELHNNMLYENNTLSTRRQITSVKNDKYYEMIYNTNKYKLYKNITEEISYIYDEKSSDKRDIMYIYKSKSK